MLDGLTLQRPALAEPPAIFGTARLAALAFGGRSLTELLGVIGPEPLLDRTQRAGWLLDRSLAYALTFHADEAALAQAEALAITRVFRVQAGVPGGTRVLAIMAPGNLMVNAPLDFLTERKGFQLDLAFTDADGALPAAWPEHDVAIVAVSETHPVALAGLAMRLADWPCPVLNDPARAALLSRDWVAATLGALPGIVTAPTIRATRSVLRRQGVDMLLPEGAYPVLLRPLHAHAGDGLIKIDCADDMPMALLTNDAPVFYLAQYIDYRSPDGWFHKYRIAFVDGAPFLCHMAASEHWMVHYLNAGMTESQAKRNAEAKAMAEFETGFAMRHRAAFIALCATIGLDYFSIDCAEAPDGRLLVFEADVAAIIHSMDDPAIYPYKHAVMQRCYDAFAAMLDGRAGAYPTPQRYPA